MRLNQLTSKVLHKDIVSVLSGNDDEDRRKLLYNVVLHSLGGDASTTWQDTSPAGVQDVLRRILSHVLASPHGHGLLDRTKSPFDLLPNPLPSESLADLSVVRDALFDVARIVAVWQVGLLDGDTKADTARAGMANSIFAAVLKYVTSVMNAADAAVSPVEYTDLGAVDWSSRSSVSFTTAEMAKPNYLAAVRVALRTALTDRNNIPSEIQAWLFPEGADPSSDGAAVKVLAAAAQPYFVFRFFASFTQGSWNLDAMRKPKWQRSNVDFYDERYARFLIMDVLKATLMKLADDEASSVSPASSSKDQQDQSAANWSKLNTAYGKLVTMALAASRIETGDAALSDMYQEVSGLSDRTKKGTLQLAAQSTKFERRRGFMQSMRNNLVTDESELVRRKRAFWAWVAAYTIVVLVGVVLIGLKMNAAFMLHAGAAMLIVALVALVGVIRAWLGGKRASQ